MAGPRPGGVTLVAVLTWISGLLSVITGVFALIGSAAGGPGSSALVAGGWIAIAIGVFQIIVGAALLQGSKIARALVTLSFLLNIGSAIYSSIINPATVWSAIVTTGIAVIGLVLLWSRKASAFFE